MRASAARCWATSTWTGHSPAPPTFTGDFQEFITRYAWGAIWTRPGLDRRSRSLVTLTALVALGHDEELALHLRAARRNGLTRGRDQRGAAADGDLLRRPGGELSVPRRGPGIRRGVSQVQGVA